MKFCSIFSIIIVSLISNIVPIFLRTKSMFMLNDVFIVPDRKLNIWNLTKRNLRTAPSGFLSMFNNQRALVFVHKRIHKYHIFWGEHFIRNFLYVGWIVPCSFFQLIIFSVVKVSNGYSLSHTFDLFRFFDFPFCGERTVKSNKMQGIIFCLPIHNVVHFFLNVL